MINYSTIDTGMAIEDSIVYGVFEDRTKQVIAVSVIRDLARSVVKGLNLGQGFDGTTPAFFMNGRPQIIPQSDHTLYERVTKT